MVFHLHYREQLSYCHDNTLWSLGGRLVALPVTIAWGEIGT